MSITATVVAREVVSTVKCRCCKAEIFSAEGCSICGKLPLVIGECMSCHWDNEHEKLLHDPVILTHYGDTSRLSLIEETDPEDIDHLNPDWLN